MRRLTGDDLRDWDFMEETTERCTRRDTPDPETADFTRGRIARIEREREAKQRVILLLPRI